MKKLITLLKASMTEGMNVFKVNTKKKNTFTKIVLPIFIAICIMAMMFSYAEMLMDGLVVVKMEYVMLTLFIMLTSIMTLIEGIYKSGNLLFNCRDDNLLFSLPVRKSSILFIRVFKFYVFELIFNSLFLLPAMVSYAIHTNPGTIYYIVSLIGLFIFPIVPILLSCILGTIITFLASKFKGKNIAQTIITVIFLMGIMYFSYNAEGLLKSISQNASSINDFITKIYYPAGKYIELILSFNILGILEFIGINIAIFILAIILIGKVYFNINSSVKSVKTSKSKKNYKIKTRTPVKALMKKEFNRFINSPVFITNAGFGLILFIIGSILLVAKFGTFVEPITSADPNFSVDLIKSYIPVILLGLICFTSFMTSITSSMISLEGKSFNILKSIPLKPITIIQSKVLTALAIMLPCILIGDIIVFIKFKFDLLSILIILYASILLPLISETFGIIINLKYPKMDGRNDTEVVKQSLSSTICVFSGMVIIGITIFFLLKAIFANFSNIAIMLIFIAIYTVIYLALLLLLHKTAEKSFDNIEA